MILSDIKVYPNPTNGELKIEWIDSKIEMIEMIDVMGKRLFTNRIRNTNEIVINISYLSAGIYYLIIDGKMMKVVKI